MPTEEALTRLRRAVDAIVPADEDPSASAVGVVDFFASEALRSNGWAERVAGVLDRLDAYRIMHAWLGSEAPVAPSSPRRA